MSTKSYIKKAIKQFARENSVWFIDYSRWYIGITNNPDVRKGQHGQPEIWRSWMANSVEEARKIEVDFLELGMKGNTGGGLYANYIYVYKT